MGDPRLPAVLTVPEAARLLRISRGAAYEAVRMGQIPSVRIGRRVLIPTALLLRMLGEGQSGSPLWDLEMTVAGGLQPAEGG
jgi:excisionase family DNA binding protein